MERHGDPLRLLGRRIAELRQERNMSLETLASHAGLDPGELAAIEAGEVDISLTTIHGLARAFGISPEQFLNFPG